MLSRSKIYPLVIISIIFYTFNGVINFMVIRALGVGLSTFSIGIGMLIGTLLSITYSG